MRNLKLIVLLSLCALSASTAFGRTGEVSEGGQALGVASTGVFAWFSVASEEVFGGVPEPSEYAMVLGVMCLLISGVRTYDRRVAV